MTFRRLAEGGLLLAAAPMHSRTLLQPPNITLKIETQDVLFFFCLFFLKKAEMNGDGPNNAQHLHRRVPVVAAIAATT